MKFKFYQGWTDWDRNFIDITFFRITLGMDEDFEGHKTYSILIFLFNFGIQIDI